MLPVLPPALLALADGTTFLGTSIGAPGHTVGEVVFNTALTGYQEILTDPSYCRQIVTLTYPHIGNVGVNEEDVEAAQIHAAGLIVKDVSLRVSNFRATMTLPQYLQREGAVAIADIDTRRLTRVLRSTGAQNGCIVTFEPGSLVGPAHVQDAVARARAAPSMAGLDLARVVSAAAPLPVSLSAPATVSASVTSATTVVSASTASFMGGAFHVTSAGTTCTITYEQSNDGTNWVTLPVINASGCALARNGFVQTGDAEDPDEGPVWRWERIAKA